MTELEKAARQALEALDGLYLPGELERVNTAITAIREALAEQPAQQQEPVAVVTGTYGGRFTVKPVNPAMVLPLNMALYTRPQPAAQWVGLTDAEKLKVRLSVGYDQSMTPEISKIQDATEAKLREKNGTTK